jgi:hypothetical protein
MLKKATEQIYFMHEFRRTDGRGWLNSSENVSSAVVVITDAVSGADVTAAMNPAGAAPYNSTQVRYRVIGGTAGKSYIVTIRPTTSNGQVFEDTAELRVI